MPSNINAPEGSSGHHESDKAEQNNYVEGLEKLLQKHDKTIQLQAAVIHRHKHLVSDNTFKLLCLALVGRFIQLNGERYYCDFTHPELSETGKVTSISFYPREGEPIEIHSEWLFEFGFTENVNLILKYKDQEYELEVLSESFAT